MVNDGDFKRMGWSGASRLIHALSAHDDAVLEPGRASEHIGDYLIEREIGRGGSATVYLCVRPETGLRVAVKLYRASFDDDRARQRAWRELDLLGDHRLPGLPRIHDYGVHDGRMYIVSDYVDGYPIDRYCDRQRLTLRNRVELLANVAMIVQGLHERGVIHRDLKPSNVLIDSAGRPVVIDLGIAVVPTDHEALTADGIPIGTPQFMAPEQARGERSSISTRSDVFGLGATAFYLLTGHPPFDVNVPLHEAIRRVGQDVPRDPRILSPRLPKALAAILRRATAADPSARFPTAIALAEDLRRWLRGEPVHSQRPQVLRSCWLSMRRKPGLWASSTAAVLAIAASVVLGAVAVAQANVAERERSAAAYERQLREEAAELNESMAAFAADQEQANQDLERRSRALEQRIQDFAAREQRLIDLRKRQIARVETAIAEGDFIGATLVLLNFAEDVAARDLDDDELVTTFVDALHRAIAAAENAQHE